MAEPRSTKLKRLVAVQRQVERLAEGDLAGTNRERARIAETIEETVAAMGSMSPTHQLFTPVYARRIASLTVIGEQLKSLAGVQEKRVMRERVKGDRLEERRNMAQAAETREAEDESLLDIIDQITGRAAAQASRKPRSS